MKQTRQGALRWLGLVAALAPVAAFGQSSDMKTLNALRNEYYKALETYYAPYEKAKTDEERAKVQLDPKKDPSRPYLKKFEALALKVKGRNEVGPHAERYVIDCATHLRDKVAFVAAKASLDRLLKLYIDGPLTQSAGFNAIENAVRLLNPRDPIPVLFRTLRQVEARSKVPENKAGALYQIAEELGASYGSHPQPEKALRLYNEVIAKYPRTRAAQAAKAARFEMQTLAVGKVAPNFVATDEDGKSWKLSDYRGRVVVLDFWGFW